MRKVILFLFIIILLSEKVLAFYEDNLEYEESEVLVVETVSYDNLILNSKNAILYDDTYDKILFEKDANKRVPNASTTKILTAIVAFENGNLNDEVIVSQKAARIGGSGINLRTNDKIKLSDLIKGLLIRSGNDAAIAIAEHVGGTEEKFCEMMNEKAKSMNLKHTHFVTPHGLDNADHYSTAYDLAKMAEYLLEIEYLSNIVKEKSVTIKINDNNITLNTTNEMLTLYEGANGVKTGFTGNAGRCLVSSASKNGRRLIAVVLGCGTKKQRTEDSVKLLNLGFENYEIVDICEKMEKEFEIYVKKSKNDNYKIVLTPMINMPILRDEKEKITYKYEFYENLEAPLKKDEIIGKIYINLEDKTIKIIDILAPKTIEKKGIIDFFNKISSYELKKYEIRL